MASTSATNTNLTFNTTAVPIVVGVLNPSNTAQAVWICPGGMSYAVMTTIVTGGPASFTIVLEGSYDGATWTTIATTTNTSGETVRAIGTVPFTGLRARCTAVTGGTSPTVNVYVTASQTPLVAQSGTSTAVAVVGSVDSTQVVNRNQSVSATGTSAAAPTSGTAIVTLGLFDFYYQVDVYVGFGGTAETTTADNFVLKAAATTLYTLPAVNVANQLIKHTFFVNPGGSVNLTVNVGGTNASAGAIYKAAIIATRLV